MGAAMALAETVGVQESCTALGVSRARFYRERRRRQAAAAAPVTNPAPADPAPATPRRDERFSGRHR